MTQTQTLPHWQLDSIYPGLDSPAFEQAKTQLREGVAALETLMNEHNIRKGEALTVTPEAVATFEEILSSFNTLYRLGGTIRAFLTGFISTDAFDNRAKAESSTLQPLNSKLSTLQKRFTAWLGTLEIEALIEASDLAEAHAYSLRRARIQAQHLMGDEAEALLSALIPSGGLSWAKLHDDIVSRHTVRMTLPGKDEADYGLSELKILQGDPDEWVRKAAFQGELELLESNAVSFAAAMNSLKGHVNEVSSLRGWENALEESLFNSSISAAALEAMHTACIESFESFRRYFKAKAKLLGKEALDWYDLTAPVGKNQRHYSWEETKTFVAQNFANYTPKLAAFAEKTFNQGWHDVPPRKGKTTGAFCMGAPGVKESRILLNFGGTLDDIFTVAHELGHAYHNLCKYEVDRTLTQGITPMVLAETASIFCETIIVNALLENSSGAEKLAVLEQDLLGSAQLVVDIHSRFLFEKTVFEKRLERELSIEEFNEIMQGAQAATYGEGLRERNPYMWAHKGHYYSVGLSFYNYPYTFGYLFGLGLYAYYRQNPEGFPERYDDLLSSTGMYDAQTLAQRFGIDLENPDFWRGSLSIAQERVGQYERLAEELSS